VYYKGLVGSEENLDPEFDDEVRFRHLVSCYSHAHTNFQGCNSVYSTDSAEDSERERTRKSLLGKLARRRFEAMLRSLTGRRGELARCMAFSLEHAEAAAEVCPPDTVL
jgi:U2-associated protein SR140